MIIFNNLKSLIKKDKLFFVLLVSIFTVTTIAILFICDFYDSVIYNSKKNNTEIRTYTFICSNENINNNIELLFKSNNSNIENIYAVLENNKDTILAKYNLNENTKIEVGSYFSNEKAKEILLPSEASKKYRIGKEYIIQDVKYKIVGKGIGDFYEIPYKSLENTDTINSISLILRFNLSNKEIENTLNSAKKIFNVKDIVFPDESNIIDTSSFVKELLILAIVVILCLLNISFVFIGILERRKKQIGILFILGSSKKRIIRSYITEVVCIITPSFIICSLVSNYLVFPLLQYTSNNYFIRLNTDRYFLVYFYILMFLILILSAQSFRFFKKTPIEMRRGT